MKIIEVNIDRFGQFNKWSWSFSNTDFLTIYGPNEAGKSTLVAFIKCIFFGFPRKSELMPYTVGANQQNDLGGSVTLWITDVGKVRIVRHYQQKNGRATVYLENGEMVGEEILSEWFKGVTRELYEAIFCFDLDGLKGIEQLKPDELNHFLFSTGMMGNAELFEVEKKLEKEAGELFKSGGRNPVINQTITELNALRGKITSWENQMDEYETLKNEAADLGEELVRLESTRHALEQEKREFLRYKAAESLLIDYKRLENDGTALPDTSQFPEDGKERFDHWRTLAVSLQGELTDIDQKIKNIQEAINELGDDDPIFQFEREIIALGRENQERGTWQRELFKLSEQVRSEKEAIRAVLEQLNMPGVDTETIKEIPVSLSSKQTLKEWTNRWQEAIKRKSAFEMTVDEETSKLHGLKEKLKELSDDRMPEGNFIELEQLVTDYHPDRITKEKGRLQQELASLKRSQELHQFLGRLKIFLPIGQLLLFIVLSAILLLSGDTAIGLIVFGIGVIFAIAIAYFLQSLQKRFKSSGREASVFQQLKELEAWSSSDISQSLYLYNQEKSKREQLTLLLTQVEEGKKNYQNLIRKLEQINLHVNELEAGIHEWRKNMGLPECDMTILPEVYQLTEKVREQIFRMESLEKQRTEYQRLLDEFDRKMDHLGQRLNQPGLKLEECDSKLERAKLQKSKKEKLWDTLEQLSENRQSLRRKISHYDEECQSLMKAAGAPTEEDFYRIAKMAETKDLLQEQLRVLNRQLMHLVPQEDIRKQYFTWLSEGYWDGQEEIEYSKQIDDHNQRIQQIQKRESEIQSRLDQMEKDETYADLLHEYEEKRFFLNEEAKKWGTLNIALSLLKQAKEDYRETRLPKVLEGAGDYLYRITNRRYKKIYYTEADGFTLEATNGDMFSAEKLSRGTGEQLYLSLRLALIDVYKTPKDLPIIIDDGFVNFDSIRRRQVIDVLKEVANKRQVLLFTCHRYKTKDILELTSKYNIGGEFEHVGSIVSDSAR